MDFSLLDDANLHELHSLIPVQLIKLLRILLDLQPVGFDEVLSSVPEDLG